MRCACIVTGQVIAKGVHRTQKERRLFNVSFIAKEVWIAKGKTNERQSKMSDSKTCVPDNLRKALANHRLRRISSGRIEAFYLENPEWGRAMSTLIVETPEGVVIMGDLSPIGNARSDFGYDLSWFARILPEQYICHKFGVLLQYGSAEILCAVQQRFGELYWRLLEKEDQK